MFGWEFPPFNSGGLGTACYGLTRSLAKRGVEVLFVLPRELNVKSDFVKFKFADSKKYKKMMSSKIKYFRKNVMIRPYMTDALYRQYVDNASTILLKENFPYASNLYLEVLRYGAMAKTLAKEENFDVIHAHDWLSFPAGVEAKNVSKKSLVAHVHATEFDRAGNGRVNKEVYKIEKEGMKRADKVVAVSNYTKKTIVDNYEIRPSKVEVVHNGIDPDYFGKSSSRFSNNFQSLKKAGNKIVLSLGRITMQKGIDYFIRAARIVLEHNPKVIFLVAGSGDMEQKIINMVAELGISDKVFFTGFLRGEEQRAVYKAADLFVVPSVSEPFGLTVLESMVSGTPVIVSKQSGVSEVVRNALKVDFWDVDEMANQILCILKYGSLEKCLVAEGSQEVKKISWKEAADKCLNIYQNLIYQN